MGNEASIDAGAEGEASSTQSLRASDEKIRYDREILEIYHSGNLAAPGNALASIRNDADHDMSSSKADTAADSALSAVGCSDTAEGNPASVASEADLAAEGVAARQTERADSPPADNSDVDFSPALPSPAHGSPALSSGKCVAELGKQDSVIDHQPFAAVETPERPLDGQERPSSGVDSAGARDSLKSQDAQCAPTLVLPKSPGASSRSTVKRRSVAEEIHSTEKLYLSNLQALLANYCEPLDPQSGRNVLSSSMHRQIFSNLREVVAVNAQFLQGLDDIMAEWDSERSTLGPHMQHFAPFFKCYGPYAASYASAVFLLEREKTANEDLREFIENAVNDAKTSAHFINNVLVMPVQRVPRYLLLLKELIKYTPKTHPDYLPLVEALDLMSVTADLIDESIGEGEARSKVLEIQEQFIADKVPLVTRTRRFIRQGPLKKLSRFGDLKACHFFLFSDLLVWAQGPQGGPYTKPRQVSIRGIEDAKLLSKEQVQEFDRQAKLRKRNERKRAASDAHQDKEARIKSWSSRHMTEADVVAATSKRILETLERARRMLADGIISESEYRKMAELNLRLIESESDSNEQHSFIIYGKERSFWVSASSRKEKMEWILDIRTVLRRLQQTTRATFSHNDAKLMAVLESTDEQLSPVFTPNHFSNVCGICNCELGLMKGARRHHCRVCGALVCSACSKSRRKIHGKLQRVCRLCDGGNNGSGNGTAQLPTSGSSRIGNQSSEHNGPIDGTALSPGGSLIGRSQRTSRGVQPHTPSSAEIIDTAAEALERGEISREQFQRISSKASLVDVKRMEAQQSERAQFLGMQQTAREQHLSAAIMSRIHGTSHSLTPTSSANTRQSSRASRASSQSASSQSIGTSASADCNDSVVDSTDAQ